MDDLEKIKKFYKNQKILIIGSTGFIGSWLSVALINLNAKVYGIGLKHKTNPNLFNSCRLEKKLIKNYFIDIRNKKLLKKTIFKIKPKIIFHLAAETIVNECVKNPIKAFETNFMGTLNILDVVNKLNYEKKIIIFTTDKVYKNSGKDKIYFNENSTLWGDDPYSASKVATEQLVDSITGYYLKKTKVITIRAGNVIGGGDWSNFRIIPDIIKGWKNKTLIQIRNRNSIRPWQYILDVIFKTLFLTTIKRSNYSKYNIAPPKKNNIKVDKLISLIKQKIKIKTKYIFFKNNEKKNLLLESKYKFKYYKKSETSIEELLDHTIEWYKRDYKNFDNYLLCKANILAFMKKLKK